MLREILTGHVLAFLAEPRNREVVATVWASAAEDRRRNGHEGSDKFGHTDIAMILRMHCLWSMTPEGGFKGHEHPGGLGLLCRFLEAGTGITNWD